MALMFVGMSLLDALGGAKAADQAKTLRIDSLAAPKGWYCAA
jgi:hypothetical protein